MSAVGVPEEISATDPSWWKLGRDGWKKVLKSTAGQFGEDEVSNMAAVMTLRIVLALVPTIIAGVAIGSLVISPADIESLVASAEDFIPGTAQEFVTEQLQSAVEGVQDGATTAIILSVLTGLFSASGAATSLLYALNRAYDIPDGRSFVAKRLVALGVIGALFLSLFGMLAAIIFGPTILESVLPQSIIDSPLNLLIGLGRFVAAVAILIGFFGFAFWFGPNHERSRLRFFTPGATFGVLGWLLLSYLFGLYVQFSGSFSATYGVFAGVIVLLVWLNYSFTVLIMAAELDHEIELHLAALEGPTVAEASGGPGDDGTGVAAGSRTIDLDAVDDDMPRHPGLMAAADDGEEDPEDTPPPRLGPSIVLQGAAAKTSGAATAARILSRMRR